MKLATVNRKRSEAEVLRKLNPRKSTEIKQKIREFFMKEYLR